MGLQEGWNKFPGYIYPWDSRHTAVDYHKQDWPERTDSSIRENNVKWKLLVTPRKVLIPPLEINWEW